MKRSIQSTLALAVVVCVAGLATAQEIDYIQYYNPTTGAPASPYIGTTQTVEGRIYVLKGTYDAGTHYIIDFEGNGIAFISSSAPPLTYGDWVSVTGTVSIIQGEIQISPAPTVTFRSAEVAPAPVVMTIAQAKSDYENVGKFVSISGTISTPVASNQFKMHAGTDTIIVYVDTDTGINTDGVAVGDSYRVIAPLVNFTGGVIMLKPRRQSDLHESTDLNVIHVKSDGGGDFPTIQSAINFADDGDTVVVDCGVYYGPGNRDIDFCGKAIVVTSTTGTADCVTIDCQGSASEPHRGFIFQTDETSAAVLRGFTVRSGYTDRGGGILCDAPLFEFGTGGASPTIINCVVRECGGGGVYIQGAYARPAFIGCKIVHNIGAGVYSFIAAPSYRRCDFSYNTGGICGMNQHGYVTVDSCQAISNTGSGISFWTEFGTVTIRHLTCTLNSGMGMSFFSSESGEFDLDDCNIHDNGGDGLNVQDGHLSVRLANSVITRNQGDAVDILCWSRYAIENCRLEANTGCGVFLRTNMQESTLADIPGNHSRISACDIIDNGLAGVQGAYNSWWDDRVAVEGCVIRGNGGPGIELTLANNDSLEIVDSTVHDNAGIGLDLDAPVIIVSRTLVTANDQSAVVISNGSGAPIITCTDLWGNGGGDWTPPLDTYLGQDGNISADPMYCGPDLAILDLSPCLPGNHPAGTDCGIIGARGMGCTAGPIITSISDVGNDEGRQVRLIWQRSFYDASGSEQPIMGYGIYRRQDAWKSRMRSSEATVVPVAEDHPHIDDKLMDWDWLATVPARGDAAYQLVAATLCDSTANAGNCWSVFLISAMTADPLKFFDSVPDSGYSTDNLPPEAPVLSIYDSMTYRFVSWQNPDAADFMETCIYRGETPGFVPGEPIQCSAGEAYQETHLNWYAYKARTFDMHGNASEWSNEVVGRFPTDVPGVSPTVLRLYPNQPNPFNPQTTIKYDVPFDGRVVLRVYDIRGALISTLVDSDLPRGSRQATWDGRDAAGRVMASGSYFVRLEAGGRVETARMALVR